MVYRLFNTSSKLLSAVKSQFNASFQTCALCGLASCSDGFCKPCQQAISICKAQCQRCGAHLAIGKPYCGFCLKKAPPFDRFVSACDYQFPINKAISQMKFQKKLNLVRQFSLHLSQKIEQDYQQDESCTGLPEQIIPIPLHPKRLRERGYNQSLILAKIIGQQLNIEVASQHLVRVKNTPHQIGLKATERRTNLKGAFQVKAQLAKHIALVDDVYTTGSTINEAVKVCRKHGAQIIDVWCLARTQQFKG